MSKLKDKYTVIALGGSILVPKNIQIGYLKRLRNFILDEIKRGNRFIIVVGGGATARDYQNAAAEVSDITDEDKDWIGIHSTRLNAHLLRTIFHDHAYPVVLDNPEKPIEKSDLKKYPLFIASGWRPGWSTDYIAFRLAHRFGASEVVVATKIKYIYSKNLDKHEDAKPLKEITWEKYENILPDKKWQPGMKVPIDPVATKFAKRNNIGCILLRGTNISNLKKYTEGKSFDGTVIT
ncbi:MAG: UMP kinase [Candidatus Spechtbacterales bacterium]|nr:UMP kinase [Candidatus Spechtbacterales bacterium]